MTRSRRRSRYEVGLPIHTKNPCEVGVVSVAFVVVAWRAVLARSLDTPGDTSGQAASDLQGSAGDIVVDLGPHGVMSAIKASLPFSP